jgi:hypothetical protein
MDTTFNLIKDIHPSHQKYKVGFINGLSSAARIVPFCFFVTIDETKDRYLEIIRTFLTTMNSQPSIFITDEAHSIKSALR